MHTYIYRKHSVNGIVVDARLIRWATDLAKKGVVRVYICSMYVCRCTTSYIHTIYTIYTYICLGWRSTFGVAEGEGGRPDPEPLTLCAETSKQRNRNFNGEKWTTRGDTRLL